MLAKTYFGLEQVLLEELKALGALNPVALNRAVQFEGNTELLYKCNLHLRTAVRILKPIVTFEAKDEEELYTNIKSINWSYYMKLENTLALNGTTSSEYFKHSKFIALKCKDAIVDQFREKTGDRPNIDIDAPDIVIDIHIYNTTVTVSLDSSGETLSKRGYRHHQTAAPISEALAAGIIALSGWDKKSTFVDPMCGSGTFAIEAALMLKNIAPGRLRSFCFENWKEFDEKLWDKVYEESEANIEDNQCHIISSDEDKDAVQIAMDNADSAGVSACIDFSTKNIMETKAIDDCGTIIINPPYGERLNNPDDVIPLYQEMGTHLKHNFNGYDAWIISSNFRALKMVGLRPTRKIALFNGSLDCRLNKFELYRGSKKDAYKDQAES